MDSQSNKKNDLNQQSAAQEMQRIRQELPIYEFKEQIVELIKANLFSVITGETGSGKSTQIAQYIIESTTKQDFAQLSNEEFTKKFQHLTESTSMTTQGNEQVKQNLKNDDAQEFKKELDENHKSTTSPDSKEFQDESKTDQLELKQEQVTESQQSKSQHKHIKSQNSKSSSSLIRVVVTQPRRVAAIQMAKRVSEERQTVLGDQVGYSIRFDDHSDAKRTQIKYVTDGILVRECLLDADLRDYQVVILDEAHERSLNTDILFALVKQAVLRRKGTLRLVVTSATLKTERISEYYYGCPVISVSGRCYPVSIMHISSPKDQRVENSVSTAIRIHLHEPAGDILVFLTGFEECEKATKLCFQKLQEIAEKKQKEVPPMMIVPLYGSQTTDQQANAFVQTPENCRKIIFSTNIAETSLTVSNIGYVIDCGFVKQKIYNTKTGMEQLLVVPISKVQAIQRAGRAGRTREGKCIRLYAEKFYQEQMPNSTVPEIKRVNLTSTVLTLKNLGINDIINFDYLDQPEQDSLEFALRQLYYLQAIDKNGVLRDLGRELCKFPLEPTYSKALLASWIQGNQDDMIKLVSILSSENIWLMISKNEDDALKKYDDVKKRFMDKHSDHMSIVDIYDQWDLQRYNKDEWCYRNFIQQRSLRQAKNIKDQLKDYLLKIQWDRIKKDFTLNKNKESKKRSGQLSSSFGERSKLLRKALSQGFFMNTSRQVPNMQEGTYLTVNEGLLVKVDRKSNLGINQYYPDWVIYTELSGAGQSGIMKMSFEIKLSWVEDKMPLLKEVDVKRLSGGLPEAQEESKNEKNSKTGLGSKRKNESDSLQLQQEQEIEEQSKEDKIQALKERYLKRQKKK